MSVTGWGGRTTLWVEADFGQAVTDVGAPPPPSGNANWDIDRWDTGGAVWAGRDPEWTDITADVRGISTSHSFSRQTNQYGTSTAQVTLDNTSGDYSPTNTASPYRLGSSTTIGVLRRVRIRARYTSPGGSVCSWALFDGLIQSWEQAYPDYGTDAVVNVSLLGLESRIASITRLAQTAQGAGETSGARVRRILDDAGWTGPIAIDDGETTMQATTLEGSVMNELQLVADSEGGFVYWRPDGTAVFDSLNAQVEKGRLENPVVFSDEPELLYTPINYRDISHSYNGDLVANRITYQRVGGVAQYVDSPNSRSLYGDRSVARSDLITQSDAHVRRLANRDLAVLQNPELRVESLTFSPITPARDYFGATSDYPWYALASGSIALREGVRINHNPKGEASAISRLCFVEGLAHSITPTTWDVALAFSSASAYENVGGDLWDGVTGVSAGYFGSSRWGW